jgi:hypothetical protein
VVAAVLLPGSVATGSGIGLPCPPGRHLTLAPLDHRVYAAAFPSFSAANRNEDAVSRARMASFEARSGKPLAWAVFSNHWDGARIRFPRRSVQLVWGRGSLPLVRMLPWSRQELGRPDPVFRMRDLARGRWDDELRAWASAARESGIPIMVDFAPEMNGDWFPWSGALSGGAAGARAYRDAYRRVVRLFREQGAVNVGFAFHVDAEGAPSTPWNTVRNYYPGDRYVDWVGASVYGSDALGQPWREFAPLLARVQAEVRALAPGKPFAVFEWGVVEDPSRGDKRSWIRDAFAALRGKRLSSVRAVSWWDERWRTNNGRWNDLRISSSPGALSAYRAGIGDRRYLGRPRLACVADGRPR